MTHSYGRKFSQCEQLGITFRTKSEFFKSDFRSLIFTTARQSKARQWHTYIPLSANRKIKSCTITLYSEMPLWTYQKPRSLKLIKEKKDEQNSGLMRAEEGRETDARLETMYRPYKGRLKVKKQENHKRVHRAAGIPNHGTEAQIWRRPNVSFPATREANTSHTTRNLRVWWG